MTRNDRFNQRCVKSIDEYNAQLLRAGQCPFDPSDSGIGAQHIIDAIDWHLDCHLYTKIYAQQTIERELIQILFGTLLMLTNHEHLVPTFDLICLHGRFRNESIKALVDSSCKHTHHQFRSTTRRYERQRKQLLELCEIYTFRDNSIKMSKTISKH